MTVVGLMLLAFLCIERAAASLTQGTPFVPDWDGDDHSDWGV